MKKTILVLLLLAISEAGWAASFDCTKAIRNVDEMICMDRDLSKMDEELDEYYKVTLQAWLTNPPTQQTQEQWVKQRNACEDRSCLKEVYKARIKVLRKWTNLLEASGKMAGQTSRWYIQQGKGRPLCETLTRIANEKPPIRGVIPNVPWERVLSLEGVREPEWKELDPLKYEEFFLRARAFIASKGQYDEATLPFPRWFLPPKERWIDPAKIKPISDEEALKYYRDFASRGGKLKVLRYNISDTKEAQFIRDIVQYESPEKAFSGWDGYTVEAEPGLSGPHDFLTLGRSHRILIYNNGLFSFIGFSEGYGEYRVDQLGGDKGYIGDEKSPYYDDYYYCKIDSETINRRNKK